MNNKKIALTILLNYFPFLFGVGFFSLLYCFGLSWKLVPVYLMYIYILPPLLCRLISLFFKKERSHYSTDDSFYFYWWFTVQLQVVYLRFPQFEEALRMVPMLYSAWLRLWGAKIGQNNYWSAKVAIMDRPFLNIGSEIVFGYGVNLSSHYVKNIDGCAELVLEDIVIEDKAMLGGISGMSTGAKLCSGELLPGTVNLLPFQQIKDGKKSFREDISRKRS